MINFVNIKYRNARKNKDATQRVHKNLIDKDSCVC